MGTGVLGSITEEVRLSTNEEVADAGEEDKGQALSLPTDVELMSWASKGDCRAFHTVFLRYHQAMVDFIGQRYPSFDDHTAEDVVADLFLRAWERRHCLRTVQNVQSYLKTIAKNIVADRYRKRTMIEQRLSADAALPDLSLGGGAEQKETADQIALALTRLARSRRQVLELAHEGLSAKEIASVANCTEKAARRRLAKAREQMRQILSRCGSLIHCPACRWNFSCGMWCNRND